MTLALKEDEVRQDILACARVILNPKLALFVYQSMDEVQGRDKNVTVSFAIVADEDLIRWLKPLDYHLPKGF